MKRREFLGAAAQTSLTVGAAAVAGPLFGFDRQGTVSGRVLGEGKPLNNVSVSDGRRIARTNDRGEYQLTVGPDSGRFVFVTTPRGWWSDAFYVRVEQAAKTDQAQRIYQEYIEEIRAKSTVKLFNYVE